MAKRSITERQRAWLTGELVIWRDRALVADEVARRILDLYDTSTEIADRRHSKAILTLMGLAALLVGLAALLLVGYNWNDLGRGVKLAIVFGVIIGTHAGALALRYRWQARALSEAVLLLACLFYGAGIWLIAQIFHINAHYPDGVWWWAVGVLPIALCLDTLLLHVLLAGLLAIWAGLEVINFSHLGAWLFGRWSGWPNAAVSLPLIAFPGLMWAYRKQSPATIGLYAPLVAWWVILQPFAWRWSANPTYFIGTVGALFLVAAESHPRGSRFAVPYRLYGCLLAGGALVPLSFYDVNIDRFGDRASYTQPLALLLLTAVTLSVAWAFRRSAAAWTSSSEEGSGLDRRWMPAGLALAMVLLSWPQDPEAPSTAQAVLSTVLANAAMLAGALWLTAIGLREDRARPFAAGVGYFLLWAVLRYVDLFGDVGGMLGASAMFFLCGATLFGVASYWRRRRGTRHD